MLQNTQDIEIPHSPTIVMGSNPSTNIAWLLHEEMVRQFGYGGFAPIEGSEPLVDPNFPIFPIGQKPLSDVEWRLIEEMFREMEAA